MRRTSPYIGRHENEGIRQKHPDRWASGGSRSQTWDGSRADKREFYNRGDKWLRDEHTEQDIGSAAREHRYTETSGRNTEEVVHAGHVEFSDIYKTKVFDSMGRDVGKVHGIHVDPKTLRIEGISLNKPSFNGSDFVPRNNIASITDEAVVLSSTPISEYLGMKVFDATGHKVGKVKRVRRSKDGNDLSIVVNRGLFRDDLVISNRMIGNVGDSVILRRDVEA